MDHPMYLGRMRRHRLVREPFWILLLVAAVAGTVIGTLVARETHEAVPSLLGQAWSGTAKQTKSVLATLFSLQITALTIVLSLNAPLMQSAANQYSPRLVPFYLKNAPLRRAVPLFVLSCGYVLASVRELGFVTDDVLRPRPVVSGAFVLLLVAFSLLMIDLIRTLNFMRVERVLRLVADGTIAAVKSRLAQLERLPLDASATVHMPPRASPILASRSGYIVEVDVTRLVRLARAGDVRVRISRGVGDYVDEGEVVGWVGAEAGAVTPRLLRDLAMAIDIAPTRESDRDPMYGLRILADVAVRALGSSAQDGYTARQALQQIRSALRYIARVPSGDVNVVDRDGAVRVSVLATQLREHVSLAVDAPLRHGAGEPEVLDGVLEIALEIGLIARDPEGLDVAYDLIARVLDDSTGYGDLDAGRREHLHYEADLVRAALENDAPRPERHARADWALPRRSLH
jgi:uncharacterized membrane protein